MDEATKKYLDERFENIASTQNDILTLVDKRFDVVDQRFNTMDKRFDSLEEKLDTTVNQVSGHEKRIAFLEDKVLH